MMIPANFTPAGVSSGMVRLISMLSASELSMNRRRGQIILSEVDTLSKIVPQPDEVDVSLLQSAVVLGYTTSSNPVLFRQLPLSFKVTFQRNIAPLDPMNWIAVWLVLNWTLRFVFPSFSTVNPLFTSVKSVQPLLA